jgi:hypothetical protein
LDKVIRRSNILPAERTCKEAALQPCRWIVARGNGSEEFTDPIQAMKRALSLCGFWSMALVPTSGPRTTWALRARLITGESRPLGVRVFASSFEEAKLFASLKFVQQANALIGTRYGVHVQQVGEYDLAVPDVPPDAPQEARARGPRANHRAGKKPRAEPEAPVRKAETVRAAHRATPGNATRLRQTSGGSPPLKEDEPLILNDADFLKKFGHWTK